ncbi:hypothetical protein FHS41_003667 [Streptomyces violarus]|uniref:Uncharacterized protein n=1 Tax=Streptomyces violarus TaxID=67380 RepID=A0A7W5F247_9ACTN|nr:hypothetical protein [Streptomyces violarus]
MRPRGAVETLGDTAYGGAGPVAYDGRRDRAVGAQQLPQRLHGVEQSVLAGSGEGDAAPADGQLVPAGGEGVSVVPAGGLRPGPHDQGAGPGGVRDAAGPGLPQQRAQGLDGVGIRRRVREQRDLVGDRDRGAVGAQRLRARPDGEVGSGRVGSRRRGRAGGGRSRHRGGRGAEASGDDGDREGDRPLPTPQSHRPPPGVSDRNDEPTTRPVKVSTRVAVVTDLPES